MGQKARAASSPKRLLLWKMLSVPRRMLRSSLQSSLCLDAEDVFKSQLKVLEYHIPSGSGTWQGKTGLHLMGLPPGNQTDSPIPSAHPA